MPGLLRLPLRLHPGPLLFGPGEATVHSLHPLPLSFLWIPALRDLHRKSECSRMVSGLAACLSSQPGLAAAASTPLRPQFLVPHLLPPRRGPQAWGGGAGQRVLSAIGLGGRAFHHSSGPRLCPSLSREFFS